MASTTPVRMWRWRASPLRRRSDRVEAWVLLAALLVAVLGSLAAAVLTWSAVYTAASGQRAGAHRVTGVSLKDADSVGGETFSSAPGGYAVRVPVRWITADGTPHRGSAEVPDGTRAGAEVAVWVGPDGDRTAPPGAPPAALQATLSGVAAGGTAAGLVWAARALVRRRLDHRRAEQWERDWAQVEPRWRHRTP